jgi:hypothetical protein
MPRRYAARCTVRLAAVGAVARSPPGPGNGAIQKAAQLIARKGMRGAMPECVYCDDTAVLLVRVNHLAMVYKRKPYHVCREHAALLMRAGAIHKAWEVEAR